MTTHHNPLPILSSSPTLNNPHPLTGVAKALSGEMDDICLPQQPSPALAMSAFSLSALSTCHMLSILTLGSLLYVQQQENRGE